MNKKVKLIYKVLLSRDVYKTWGARPIAEWLCRGEMPPLSNRKLEAKALLEELTW